MSTDVFKKRGSALEDEFFRRVDRELAEKLREQWLHDRDIAALKRETRIEDDAVIEELFNAGIHPGMIKVLTLVPAIHVAWANGFVERKEREAVRHAANTIGIAPESTEGQLLASWLTSKPAPELFQAWHDYVVALFDVLDIMTYRQLHRNAVAAAEEIAQAAGGLLGVHAVSVAERRAINEIDGAFTK